MTQHTGWTTPLTLTIITIFIMGCGGSTPEPKTPSEEDMIDPITAIIGEVEVDESILEEDEHRSEVYTGPTIFTVNLRVVNEVNPKGSWALIDAEGNRVREDGILGVPAEVNQGTYTIEFKSPVVFGSPIYREEDVQVAGREQEFKAEFPAGQVTLHTYSSKPSGRCVPTKFTIFSETNEADLPGKGTSCEPLILEVGNYDVKLHLTKRKYTSVKLPINKGQVRTNKVRLTAD